MGQGLRPGRPPGPRRSCSRERLDHSAKGGDVRRWRLHVRPLGASRHRDRLDARRFSGVYGRTASHARAAGEGRRASSKTSGVSRQHQRGGLEGCRPPPFGLALPGTALNYLAGVTGLRLRVLSCATLIGIAPPVALYVSLGIAGGVALDGSGVGLLPTPLLGVGVVTTAAAVFIVSRAAKARLRAR